MSIVPGSIPPLVLKRNHKHRKFREPSLFLHVSKRRFVQDEKKGCSEIQTRIDGKTGSCMRCSQCFFFSTGEPVSILRLLGTSVSSSMVPGSKRWAERGPPPAGDGQLPQHLHRHGAGGAGPAAPLQAGAGADGSEPGSGRPSHFLCFFFFSPGLQHDSATWFPGKLLSYQAPGVW